MTEQSGEGSTARPPFTKHFFLILLAAAVASAAMDTVFGNRLPSDFGNRLAFFLGSGFGAALLALLVYWITWKGGVGRNPVGAGWGAAAFMLFFILIDHLGQAKLLP